MNRGAWLLGALTIATVAIVWIGVRSLPSGSPLESACEDLLPGDPLEQVYRTLGPEGYQPGCGLHLPCEELVMLDRTWLLSCTADDCDQRWRRDGGTCDVVFDPPTRRVESAAWTRLPEL